MKRVRGVEEIGQTISSIPKQQQQQHSVTVTAGVSISSSSINPAATNSGPSIASDALAPSKTSVDYHSGPGTSSAATGLTIVSTTGAVRTVQQTKDMPSSIQYSQTQQQYPGAIVVPAVTSQPVKQTSLNTNSSCGASSLATGVTLHSGGSLTLSGNHTLGPQTQQVASSQPIVGHPLLNPQQSQPQQQQVSTIRPKLVQAPTPPASTITNSSQFQRLKVEDALSYLDQVKFKFSDQPQVYNDFLDIMKEFKSQSIDTPGVITRVSHLFKGHPELIVGFNTFLPPGYKIEVQANEQGYAFQVSVSMPSPTSTHTSTLSQHHCTVNVGSPPIASTSIPTSKAQPVVHILPGSGTVHPNVNNTNNIPNNNSSNSNAVTSTTMPIHDSSSPPSSSSYNNSHVTQAQAQAVSQALSQAQEGVPVSGQTQQNQPVEFNHAINYVNKIKNRFQSHPDKYKRFLEILHTYQKEQRTLKESGQLGNNNTNPLTSGGKHLTEAEVYSQVAKLFENQEDLLLEFGQFLPDATNQQSALSAMFQSNKVCAINDHASIAKKPIGYKPQYNNTSTIPRDQSGPISTMESRDRDRDRERVVLRDFNVTGQKFGHSQGQLKRSPSFAPQITNTGNVVHGPPPPKKHKVTSAKDASIAEVAKHGTMQDYAFFDKVRKALRSQEVYENFLRCLVLFNQEIVSKSELLQLVSPFLGRFPELLRWFKEFLGHLPEPAPSTPTSTTSNNNQNINPNAISYGLIIEGIPNNVIRNQENRPQGDLAMEIDYSTCKRLGASYCALPKSYVQPKCSGRTQLCKEVLNDTWVSFPTWSEDSTFVTSRKTQFEECIYRCEDERFELDGVIETNAATIRVLEGVQKKITRMTQEEVHKFKLDECLGGSSPTIHQRALKRIYGDKAADIIDGLKKNPLVAVPVVLRRLKAKEEEWREAQKGFNKLWREQNEKFYLKSLDHQGINFKQNDLKFLRSKSLYNEIEILYDERHEAEESSDAPASSAPHMILAYKDKSVLDDAINLLIHHVKRQTSIHKEDKQQIKQLLKHVVPDLFFHPRQELSDDEQDDDNDKDDANSESCENGNQASLRATPTGSGSSTQQNNGRSKSTPSPAPSSINAKAVNPNVMSVNEVATDPDEAYTLFFGSNNWYLFLRLHHLLCERLTKMYERAMVLAEEETKYKQQRKESTAIALRLKPKTDVEIEDYYPAFLDMVKNLLDGNMDFNTYEDTLREMFGIHAYIAFTLDKVVNYAVRQLQHLVTDLSCQQCLELFQREQKQPRETCGSGGLCHTAFLRTSYEQNYQRKAEKMLSEENCFKIYIYKKKCTMTIELLDTESDENADNGSRGDRSDRESSVVATEKWSSYVERYTMSTSSVTNVLTTTSALMTANLTDQSSPKEVSVTATASDNEASGFTPLTTLSETAAASPAMGSLPVSSDQAAKGGRGRKRKNIVDVNKKVDSGNWSDSIEKVLAGRKRVYLYRNVNQYRKLATRKARLSSPFDTANPTDRPASESKDAARGDDANSNVIASDETQCTFNLNNYRVIYVVNQETTIYKKGSFNKAKQRHREVTSKKFKRFSKWHSQWSNRHVSENQHRQSTDWLMGRCDNLINHKMRLLSDNDLNRTPYRTFNRYQIEPPSSTDSKD